MKHWTETARWISWGLALVSVVLPPAFAGDHRNPLSASETFTANPAQSPAPARLNLLVIEGEGAINNINQRTNRGTIVQVEDENHKPVAGAAVVFVLPGDGPGASFLNGSKSAAIVADGRGQAALPRMQTNQLVGRFRIRVNASYHDRQGSAEIGQSNVAGAAVVPLAHAGVAAKTIAIIAGVAVAGAASAAVGLHGGSKSSPTTSAPQPSAGISLGSGSSIGPPH
jgi:hypothetical protein